MGKSSKVTRLGNFQTHKKNVRRRTLVKEKKRPKNQSWSAKPADKAAAPVAPKAATRDDGKGGK